MTREEFRVSLSGDRWLAAEIAGPEDGDLVIFNTGTPGPRYLYEGQVRECAQRGLRIVCASRPGYDGSPRQQGRSYADNPASTLAVMECLGVESAYVIGHSCGGGPALADAAKLGERIRALAISAGFAPRLAMGPRWWDGLETVNGRELRAIQEGESALRAYVARFADEMGRIKSAEQVTSHPEFRRLYSLADRECFKGEFLKSLLKFYFLVGRDRVDGWVDDDFAFYGDWGFDLADIAVPVSIWQGDQDTITPRAHAEWLRDNVPGATLKLLSGDGHVSLFARHFGAMLDDLIERGS